MSETKKRKAKGAVPKAPSKKAATKSAKAALAAVPTEPVVPIEAPVATIPKEAPAAPPKEVLPPVLAKVKVVTSQPVNEDEVDVDDTGDVIEKSQTPSNGKPETKKKEDKKNGMQTDLDYL